MEELQLIEMALEKASKHGVYGLKEGYNVAQAFGVVVQHINQLDGENKNLKSAIEKQERMTHQKSSKSKTEK